MPTNLYAFIATGKNKRSAMPAYTRNQTEFNRRVRGIANSVSQETATAAVGTLMFRPLPDASEATTGHVLCDGSVQNIKDFPELAKYLGTTFGGDGVTTFGLPNYHNQALTTPALAVTQTISAFGTVTTGVAVTTPTGAGQTGGTKGGNILSGGRRKRAGESFA